MPQRNYDIDAISVMEELNPQPEERPEASRVKEVVVGMLLVIGVLGWVLGTWWRDESIRSDYKKAQQAVSQKRWDEALRYFTSARGYLDADARATEAARLIEERNKQYEIATAHQQAGPAALALQAGRAVQTIEPGYKDVDTLVARAKEQTYTDALLDTVVMRNDASPPGLYYRGANGWTYLRGSDRWSSTHGDTSTRHIIYDIPGPNWTPPDLPSATDEGDHLLEAMAAQREEKEGRRLMVATLDGEHANVTFEPLQFTPTLYEYYIVGDTGVWGLHFRRPSTLLSMPKGMFGDMGADYQAFGNSITRAVALIGSDGIIADLGRRGNTTLLVGRSGSKADGDRVGVYAAGPDGSNPRQVISTTGTVISASLSPDEQSAVIITAEPEGNSSTDRLRVTAKVLDIAGARWPATIAETTLPRRYGYANINSSLAERFSMSAVFLERGGFEGKLLVGWLEGDVVKVHLYDTSTPNGIIELRAISQMTFAATRRVYGPAITVMEQTDGKTLILYDGGHPLERGPRGLMLAEMKMFRAAKNGEVIVSEHSIPSPGFEEAIRSETAPHISSPLVRGDRLVYTIFGVVDRQAWQREYKVYSLLLEDIDKATPRPRQVFGETIDLQSIYGQQGRVKLGPSAVAYVDKGGKLHARLYNSDVDVILEESVDFVRPLDTSYFYKVLR
jgi:hypothetical protein